MGAPHCDHTTPAPGYSVAVLHKACGLSYVAGAPRHKQRGAVFELQKEGRETHFMPVLEGEQVPAGEGSWDSDSPPPIITDGCLKAPEGKGWALGHIVGWGLSLSRTWAQRRPLPWFSTSDCQQFPLGGGSRCLAASCVTLEFDGLGEAEAGVSLAEGWRRGPPSIPCELSSSWAAVGVLFWL